MRASLSASLLVSIGSLLPASAQSLLRTISGGTADEEFGSAMVDIGDWNVDSYDDVLVGAPGYNSDRGAVFCVSGKYLAHGIPPKFLWSLAPFGDPGDRFGASVAVAGNLNSGTAVDFLVGAPGDDNVNGVDAGAVYPIDGTNGTLRSPTYGPAGSNFGASLDGCGDVNGDALADIVVGAPGGNQPGVYQLSGYAVWYLAGNYTTGLLHSAVDSAPTGLGWIVRTYPVSSVSRNVLIGSPDYDGPAGASSGRLQVRRGDSFTLQLEAFGSTAGERFGYSADARYDFDGDYSIDFLVGAPYWGSGPLGKQGRAALLSGHALAIHAPDPVIFQWTGSSFFTRLGTSVSVAYDLDYDFRPEVLVGGPGAGATLGAVWIYSGRTGVALGSYSGAMNALLGSAVIGRYDDLDSDGFGELLVSGAYADAAGLTNNGTLKCLKLFPAVPTTYCTGKTSSLGCVPAIHWSGYASASSASAFSITCTNVLNQKSGLLFYGYDATSVPFQGGTLCVQPPSVRTPVQSSGGATSGTSCSGSHAIDFDAWIQGGTDPALTLAHQVFAQFWSRDPQSPSTTSLSNAIAFLVNP